MTPCGNHLELLLDDLLGGLNELPDSMLGGSALPLLPDLGDLPEVPALSPEPTRKRQKRKRYCSFTPADCMAISKVIEEKKSTLLKCSSQQAMAYRINQLLVGNKYTDSQMKGHLINGRKLTHSQNSPCGQAFEKLVSEWKSRK